MYEERRLLDAIRWCYNNLPDDVALDPKNEEPMSILEEHLARSADFDPTVVVYA
jgi:hypothetical protein